MALEFEERRWNDGSVSWEICKDNPYYQGPVFTGLSISRNGLYADSQGGGGLSLDELAEVVAFAKRFETVAA